ncbi:8418_t:CDS:2 [Diversispora eburnea]|uniref:8418_t:CDS:1 n=1 Tax=Diversispora eburnea TaxID=1213867 RepID=A0A9N8W435_9GLOM|nr:8418_t:CDS:2 [Diversispora eburnea]
MTEENIPPLLNTNTPKKSRARASIGTAIKRPLILSTRKNPESIEKKRRVIEATSKNIRKALKDETNILPDNRISVGNLGPITRSKTTPPSTNIKAIPQETPSQVLRQLSRVLAKKKSSQQTPKKRRNNTPIKIRTPNIVRLTPSSARRSAKKKPINKNESNTKKTQNLLRILSRAPGFVREHEIEEKQILFEERQTKNVDVNNDAPESQPVNELTEGRSPKETSQRKTNEEKEIEVDTEVQRHNNLILNDDDFSKVLDDQINETIEFTGEIVITPQNIEDTNEEFNNVIPSQFSKYIIPTPQNIKDINEEFNNSTPSPLSKDKINEFVVDNYNQNIVDEQGSPMIIVKPSLPQMDAEIDDFWMGQNSSLPQIDEEIDDFWMRRNSNNIYGEENEEESEEESEENWEESEKENEEENGKKIEENREESGDEIREESEDEIIGKENEEENREESEDEIEEENEESEDENEDAVKKVNNSPEKGPESSEPSTSLPKGPPRLPDNLIKNIFGNFTKRKITSEAMQAVLEGTQIFFEQIADDLAIYATNGKREMIKEKDGLITDKVTFESLAERHLPRELSEEVCQVAKAGNLLFPPRKTKKKDIK